MSIFSKIKARVTSTRAKTKAIAAGFAVAIASVAAIATVGSAAAAPVSTPNCDNNAVVYCGASSVSQLQSKYNNGDGHNKTYTIQDIYHGFGIGPSDISAMSTETVSGYVTKTGDVYAGSTLVATGAETAGRQYIAGSKTEKYGATTYYERTPSVSFLDSELSAMVVMKDGVFQFALLNSCGNPVTATPKKPAISVKKLVRAAGTSSYGSNVTVKSGSEVQYQITASSTGAVSAENFTVHDTLPSDIKYTSGSLDLNGKAESAAQASSFFGSGLNLGTVKNGTNEVFTFNATAGTMSATATSCVAESINNTGYLVASTLGSQQSIATVKTTCTPPPTPALSCNSLTAVPGTVDQTTGDQSYSFTGNASVSNATITSYTFDFGDSKSATVNSSSTSASTTHTYAPGTYTATVTVNATANGKTLTATAKGCQYNLTVKPPVSGTLACVGLTATPGDVDATTGDTTYTLTGKGQANGNAAITQYVFTPAINTAALTVNSSSTSASTTYTYAPGTYEASVNVNGTDNATGKSISAPTNKACEVPITVKTLAKPNYSIVKQVATAADGTYGSNVNVNSGATVYYKITVSSTGNAPVTNVNVNDSLPSDIKYASGTLQENGTAVSSSDASNFFGSGLVISSITNGSSVTFTYSAVAGNASATDPSCMTESLNNTGTISTTGLSNESSSAKVNTACTPPNYSIVKQVSTSADGTYGSNVSVKSGSTVYYKITVSSTGNAPVTNVTASDNMPTYLTYNTGTLQENGSAVSSTDATSFFAKGLVIPSITNGDSVVFTYSAVAGNTATDTDANCKAESLTNTGTIMTTGLGNKTSSATTNTTCTTVPPTPSYSILKQVSTSATGTYGNDVTVPSGSTVYYKITVSNTSATAIANVNINDKLPGDIVYSTGTLQEDGTAVTGTSETSFFGTGLTIASLASGASTTFTYSAVAGNTASPADTSCAAEDLTNTGTIMSTGLSNMSSSATVDTTCTTTPPTTPPSQTPPPVLPNTGAGDTIGIFIGTVVAGTVAARLFIGRKLARR